MQAALVNNFYLIILENIVEVYSFIIFLFQIMFLSTQLVFTAHATHQCNHHIFSMFLSILQPPLF